jgi:hypothetical protein
MSEPFAFTNDDIVVAIKSIRRGAQLACLAMTSEPQFPGKRTFSSNGAWALHWAKIGHGRGALAQSELVPHRNARRAAYWLTPFGLAVQTRLRER